MHSMTHSSAARMQLTVKFLVDRQGRNYFFEVRHIDEVGDRHRLGLDSELRVPLKELSLKQDETRWLLIAVPPVPS